MLIFPFVDFPMKKGISAFFVIFAHFGEPHECPYDLQSLIMISFIVYSVILLRHSQRAHQFLPLFLIFPWKEGKFGLICHFCSLWWAPWVTPWPLINNHDFLYCIFQYVFSWLFPKAHQLLSHILIFPSKNGFLPSLPNLVTPCATPHPLFLWFVTKLKFCLSLCILVISEVICSL